MIDGVHVGDHVVLVALGCDADGRKHVLGLWEGATENATACKTLLTNLRERGLNDDLKQVKLAQLLGPARRQRYRSRPSSQD